jgi:MFS family permease
MRRNLLPVLALLSGTLFLFLGNGLQGLLLPLRGTQEGYSNDILGLLGTTWASGFVLGCFVAPNVVRRIGHVRAFSGFLALICLNVLVTGIFVEQTAWLVLRAITGFCTAGTSMIIESWLNERATNESRGTIFSFYISITLFGVVGGQLMVPFADVATPLLFMICGMLYCVAQLPTTLSKAASPQPLKRVRLDLKGLFRNSPIACVGILLIGIANGAYGTLGAVFGTRVGMDHGAVAAMVSITIFAGAIAQFPAGRLSDRMDRRHVLAALSSVSALAGLALVLFQPVNVYAIIVLVALYGAAANALYPIAVAHANDYAAPEDFVKVSGGLLLLFGIGTIIGPTVGGPVMTSLGPHAVFAVTAAAHILVTTYAILRSRRRAPVPVAARDTYTTAPTATTPLGTPEGLSLDPRAQTEGSPDASPTQESEHELSR